MTVAIRSVRRAPWILAGFLLFAPAAFAVEFAFDIRTVDNQSIAVVAPGGTVALYVSLATSPGTAVGALFYTVECPNTAWSLATRDYASYGWYQHDGNFDGSTPIPGGSSFPVAITGDLYIGSNPTAADFSFDTVLNPYHTTITGGVVETFSLVVPTAAGDYVLGFGEMSAYDGDGVFLGSGTGHGFTVRVPEPSGLVLLGLAAAGAALLRRLRPSG